MKLMKQNKKGKNLLRHLHRRNFFFINYILFYVTKCLRSKKKKKKLNGPLLTTFGTRGNGREGWTVTNPKEKMIKKMLQLLQQRAGSGPILALLKMPVWEPESRMFEVRGWKMVK
jgi:hypothetical protein